MKGVPFVNRRYTKGVPFWIKMVYKWVPCEQRFLSCMAFTVYEIVRVACQSRSWFVYAAGCKQTNYATDKRRLRKR